MPVHFLPDPPIKRCAQRHIYLGTDAIAARDLGFARATFQVGWKSERQSFKPVSSATGLLKDNCTVYLRTADLARIGILNGDWVTIAVIYLEFQLI